MPFDTTTKPIRPHELMSASANNISLAEAELYLKGLSPGLGSLGACQLGHRLCMSRRYTLPDVTPCDRGAVAAIASAALGTTASGDAYFPVKMLEGILAHGIHGFLREIQICHVGKAIDAAFDELRASRLGQAAE